MMPCRISSREIVGVHFLRQHAEEQAARLKAEGRVPRIWERCVRAENLTRPVWVVVAFPRMQMDAPIDDLRAQWGIK